MFYLGVAVLVMFTACARDAWWTEFEMAVKVNLPGLISVTSKHLV